MVIPHMVLYMVVKHVMGWYFLNYLLSPDFAKKIIPAVSQSVTSQVSPSIH